ncbi:hypothetical protein RND71_003318 [Anisodus tanguticus]|uniref:Uncharacterized protein n=1 Tax=Anisodus tanguticus TaxID=243964 RepID=A0AAE1SVN7_9SOLA|nr:hypothetical protein RND71_003318 [Anisodus tanguticus]
MRIFAARITGIWMIWDEVGQDEFEREKVLVDIEQECLDVYRRKVDNANISRARLHQELADSEAEFTHLLLLLDERSLPGRKLEEYQNELQRLQNEKIEKLRRVENYISMIRSLAAMLGTDSSLTITKVHPSLNELSGLILEKLGSTVQSLEADKKTRLEKLHQLGKALTNLWSLMDTPQKDRVRFSNVTALISLSSEDISTPGSLTLDIIQQDDNQDSVSRGAHKNLRRAERARVMVNKIPGIKIFLPMACHHQNQLSNGQP